MGTAAAPCSAEGSKASGEKSQSHRMGVQLNGLHVGDESGRGLIKHQGLDFYGV